MVARTRLCITLYAHCLSCVLFDTIRHLTVTCNPKTKCLRTDAVKRFPIYNFTRKSHYAELVGNYVFHPAQFRGTENTSVQRLTFMGILSVNPLSTPVLVLQADCIACKIPTYGMNACGRVEVHLHSILTKIAFPLRKGFPKPAE
jgi:hypothetical protein